MADESVREVAILKRQKRMRRQLSLSVAISVFADIILRGAFSHGESKGTNMLLFILLGFAIHFATKRKIVEGDTESYAWRGRSPWLVLYWPPAAMLIVALQFKLFAGG